MSCKKCISDSLLELYPIPPDPKRLFNRGIKRFLERNKNDDDFELGVTFRFNIRQFNSDKSKNDYVYYVTHHISSRTNMFSSYKYHNARYEKKRGIISVVSKDV